jgi:hypothetical protein
MTSSYIYLLLLLLSAVAQCGPTSNSAALINTHSLLEKESADLTKQVAGMTGDIAALKADLGKYVAEVEGGWKPEVAGKAKAALDSYYAQRRELWIASRNKEFAQKMISRLVERVPKVRELLNKHFEDYTRGAAVMNAYVEAKESTWHNRRMATLSQRLAQEYSAQAASLEKKGTPAAVVNAKRASAADEAARAVSYAKNAQEQQDRSALLRSKVVEECMMPSREECNVVLRNFAVGQNRLWTAYRNKAMATDEIERLEPLVEADRVAVVEDTFKDRNLGVSAFRLLRSKWVDIWKVERARSLALQKINRIHLRMDRIWAELNDQTLEAQKKAANPNEPPMPADVAESIAGQRVTYQTTTGKQQPIAETRPVTQFSGPNSDPNALILQAQDTKIHQ